MKLVLKIFFLVSITITFYSCDDSVSLKSNLGNKYSVNLILRGDTTSQIAYVSQVYDVNGFNPYENTNDPFVDNSIVSLKYTEENSEFFFRDTIDSDNMNLRYNSPGKYYYLNSFTLKFNKQIELKVQFDDNTILKGKTTCPSTVIFDPDLTTKFIPGPYTDIDTAYYKVGWVSISTDLLKIIKINIPYYHRELSGDSTYHVKQIVLGYSSSKNDTVENFSHKTYSNFYKFGRKLVTNTLKEISKDNTQKGRYIIAPLEIEVFVLDDNLTKFYSAELFYNYGFTVTDYPGDLSNIEGGYGFFGSFSYSKKTLKFDSNYLLNNFGYLYYK